MDNFTKAEIQNRPFAIQALNNIFESTGWTITEPAAELKTRYDFVATKGDKKILIEAKHRGYRYGAFPDYMIDGKKVTALRDIKSQDPSVIGIYYINTFPEGHYAVWNISKDVGTWKLSKPHKEKTVVTSRLVQTYDLFLRLDEAVKTE